MPPSTNPSSRVWRSIIAGGVPPLPSGEGWGEGKRRGKLAAVSYSPRFPSPRALMRAALSRWEREIRRMAKVRAARRRSGLVAPARLRVDRRRGPGGVGEDQRDIALLDM